MHNRYSRQIILPNFGTHAQNLLANSKVLVVGAGGLGIPVLQYLVSAGVGELGIADGDAIEISNLQRQVIYSEAEIGYNKAKIAKEKLSNLNSEVIIEFYDFFINQHSVFNIIEKYDVVVDCTDHFSIRYLLNDVCFLLKKPLVFASVFQFEAQLSVFHYGENSFNLRDVFSQIPNQNSVPNCNESGVLGALTGIIGCLQANEVIKIITKIGSVNSGKLLLFNSLINQITQIDISKNSEIFLPKSKNDILNSNYGFLCSDIFYVDKLVHLEKLLKDKKSILIDVRERDEFPKITLFPVLEIPLSELLSHIALLEPFHTLIFICKSGLRSKKAIHLLQEFNVDKIFYSIKNGVEIFDNNCYENEK